MKIKNPFANLPRRRLIIGLGIILLLSTAGGTVWYGVRGNRPSPTPDTNDTLSDTLAQFDFASLSPEQRYNQYRLLAGAYASDGKLPQAYETLKKAAAIKADDPSLLESLVETGESLKTNEGEIEIYRKKLVERLEAKSNKTASDLLSLGQHYEKLGESQKSLDYYQAFLSGATFQESLEPSDNSFSPSLKADVEKKIAALQRELR